MLVALAAMVCLACAVAFLNPIHLAYTIQIFVVCQDVAMVGVEGAKNIPVYTQQLSAFFTYLNFINVSHLVQTRELLSSSTFGHFALAFY